MGFKKKSKKVKKDYPVGAKVKWKGRFRKGGLQSGEGEIIGHYDDREFEMVQADIKTKKHGVKSFFIGSFSDEDFKVKSLKVLKNKK